MKKKNILFLSSALLVSSLVCLPIVTANNFEGKENEYIELCTSVTLSDSQQEVCREFNDYLKEKNDDLESEINNKKEDLDKSKQTLVTLEGEIASIQDEITAKEDEIVYLETSITNLETSIKTKENDIKDRLYAMQAHVNTNAYLEFIFNASNFTDLISRIESVNELTAYDKGLIKSLITDREELEKQQESIATARNNLASQLDNKESLQNQYLALYIEQNADVIAKEEVALKATDASEDIDANLAALATASQESIVTEVIPPIVDATPPSTESSNTNSTSDNHSNNNNNSTNDNHSNNNNNSANDNHSNNENTSNNNTTEQPNTNTGSSSTGIAIANAALSKQGSPYVYGAAGPNSFDCSGLVWWAHKQAGVNFSRVNAATLASKGTAVSYSNLQPGDIITFKTDPSYVSHVGIYVGNGMMIHAPYPGSTVQVANLNISYWQNTYYNARRLY